MNVSATKLFPSGDWEICALVKGFLVSRRYNGYTKSEAVRLFKTYAKEI